jgi:hypothetical protein
MRNTHRTAKASHPRDAARIMTVDDGLGVADAGLQHSGTLRDAMDHCAQRQILKLLNHVRHFIFGT